MNQRYADKSTVEEIRHRFDNDVERFSNLETAQAATIDAPLVMELITSAAAAVTPHAVAALDIGCGAGNYTLKLLARLPKLEVTLVDLSQPMLTRAVERISATSGAAAIHPWQADIRDLSWPAKSFDIVMAAASLHHLRGDEDWRRVFRRVYDSLRPGGSFWIADLVTHDQPDIQQLMWDRYGNYLAGLGGEEYRQKVFAYVAKEDTPRSVPFQIDLLREVGFSNVDILHKNSCFAAFGAIKSV
jgi:tRNA (cmo5U34)-methyltransferase